MLCVCTPYELLHTSIYTNLGTYITASEPISAAYFIIKSHQSLRIYEYSSYRCKETGSVNILQR
jgi:hypothetical protein